MHPHAVPEDVVSATHELQAETLNESTFQRCTLQLDSCIPGLFASGTGNDPRPRAQEIVPKTLGKYRQHGATEVPQRARIVERHVRIFVPSCNLQLGTPTFCRRMQKASVRAWIGKTDSIFPSMVGEKRGRGENPRPKLMKKNSE